MILATFKARLVVWFGIAAESSSSAEFRKKWATKFKLSQVLFSTAISF
jgi:hypothetical protein